MKIILARKISSNTHDAATHIRTVFAHISYLIWIKNIKVTPVGNPAFTDQEQIVIECMPQGDVLENAELAETVRRAIDGAEELDLIKIIIAATRQDDAIIQTDSQSFDVDPYFVKQLAKNDKYRKEIQSKQVLKVTIEYQEISPSIFKPTGKIATEFQGDVKISFEPKNAYHCIAAAVSANSRLREKILKETIEKIDLQKLNNDQLKLNVRSSETFVVNLPGDGQTISVNADAIADALRTAKIDQFLNEDDHHSKNIH